MHRIQMWLLLQGSSGRPCCFSKLSFAGCTGIAGTFAHEVGLCFSLLVGADSWMETSCQAGSPVFFGITGAAAVLEGCLRFALIFGRQEVYESWLHCD